MSNECFPPIEPLDEMVDREDLCCEIGRLAHKLSRCYLNGMDGTIDYSDTLKPKIIDKEKVALARTMTNILDIWLSDGDEGYSWMEKQNFWERLRELSDYHGESGKYFSPFFVDGKKDNPYSLPRHRAKEDAERLDELLNDLFLVDSLCDDSFLD